VGSFDHRLGAEEEEEEEEEEELLVVTLELIQMNLQRLTL
jgi:hypothetical protein